MPSDFAPTIKALFLYRNRMFHLGFEWPPKARENFAKTVRESEWPTDWFGKATIDDQPWMFYMSKTFIAHCLTSIEQIAIGINEFRFEQRSVN